MIDVSTISHNAAYHLKIVMFYTFSVMVAYAWNSVAQNTKFTKRYGPLPYALFITVLVIVLILFMEKYFPSAEIEEVDESKK